jgi:hypothetical protein
LTRNGAIALMVAAALAGRRGGLARWSILCLIMLWPTLGGHFVELFFLNCLRFQLPRTRAVQVAARLGFWSLSGVGLAFAMILTSRGFSPRPMALDCELDRGYRLRRDRNGGTRRVMASRATQLLYR